MNRRLVRGMREMTRRDVLGLLSAALSAGGLGRCAIAAGVDAGVPGHVWERVARELLPEVAASDRWIFDTEGGMSAAASGVKFLWEAPEIGQTELQREARARIGAILAGAEVSA